MALLSRKLRNFFGGAHSPRVLPKKRQPCGLRTSSIMWDRVPACRFTGHPCPVFRVAGSVFSAERGHLGRSGLGPAARFGLPRSGGQCRGCCGLEGRAPLNRRAAGCRPNRQTRCLPHIPAIALFLLAGALNVTAQVTREYDLKAAFLFNFAQFVEWPASAFVSADEPFTIGVLGEDPFGAALDDVIRNERVNGRPLVVRRCRSVDDSKGCQILFISKSESPKPE